MAIIIIKTVILLKGKRMVKMFSIYIWPSTADRSIFNKSACPALRPPIKILSNNSRENLMFDIWRLYAEWYENY